MFGLRHSIVVILAAILAAQDPAAGSVQQDATTALAEHGVNEIVFSTRANSSDGHWYANLGYWSYDENTQDHYQA